MIEKTMKEQIDVNDKVKNHNTFLITDGEYNELYSFRCEYSTFNVYTVFYDSGNFDTVVIAKEKTFKEHFAFFMRHNFNVYNAVITKCEFNVKYKL